MCSTQAQAPSGDHQAHRDPDPGPQPLQQPVYHQGQAVAQGTRDARSATHAHLKQGNKRSITTKQGETKTLFTVELADEAVRWRGSPHNFDTRSQSTVIEATLWGELADKLYDALELGKVYYWTKGQVKPANKQYSNVKNDYTINFGTGYAQARTVCSTLATFLTGPRWRSAWSRTLALCSSNLTLFPSTSFHCTSAKRYAYLAHSSLPHALTGTGGPAGRGGQHGPAGGGCPQVRRGLVEPPGHYDCRREQKERHRDVVGGAGHQQGGAAGGPQRCGGVAVQLPRGRLQRCVMAVPVQSVSSSSSNCQGCRCRPCRARS